MDWTDFKNLYWFFDKAERVLYLGAPDLLKFASLTSKEMYYVSPEHIELNSPRVIKLDCNPDELELSRLPNKIDRIINCLPLSLITSFKVMSKFMDLLPVNGSVLIKTQIPKKQTQYTKMMIENMFSQFYLSLQSFVEIDDEIYVIGKKIK